MKRTTVNMMLATAALLVASTAASAQTLNAEIPFAFSAGGKLMPAGTYQVFTSTGETLIRLSNARAKQSVLVLRGVSKDPQRDWTLSEGGVLQFACGDGCALSGIWTHRGFPAQAFAPSHRDDEKPTHLAAIRMTTGPSK